MPVAVTDTVLNFNAPATMEAHLKHSILYKTANCGGRVTAVTGVSGMGGIGKTTALLALATDRDVRAAFPDGIYFLSVGQDANAEKLIEQLSNIVSATGGELRAQKIVAVGDLVKALNMTINWFKGRTVLFVADDLWETPNCPVGFLAKLKCLLESCESSGMVISTRSQMIADEAGFFVGFGPREEVGVQSRDIFLKYADVSNEMFKNATPQCRAAVDDILRMCAGVPLTLGVAGRAVRTLSRIEHSWTKALLSYRNEQLTTPTVFEKALGAYPNFKKTVMTSLRIADAWWASVVGDLGGNMAMVTCSGLLQRLCILPRQAQVRKSLVAKMWSMLPERAAGNVLEKLVDLNLVLQRQHKDEVRLGLHDLVLDYCQHFKIDNAYLHFDLLNQFRRSLRKDVHPVPDADRSLDCFWAADTVAQSMYPWWEVDDIDNDYLFSNLARHLVEARRTSELVAIVTYADWTKFRLAIGGLAAILVDFDTLLRRVAVPNEQAEYSAVEPAVKQAHRDLTLLRSAVRLFWVYVAQDHEQLATQAYARLLDIPGSGKFIERYLLSVEKSAPRVWIRPKHRCWALPSNDTDFVLPLPSTMWHGAVNWKHEKMAVAGSSCVLWVDLKRRTTVSSEHQPRKSVTSIAYSAEAEFVVTGSHFGDIQLWDSNSRSCMRTFPQQESRVPALAISPDDKTLASGTEEGIFCLWKIESGTLVAGPIDDMCGTIWSIAFHPDGYSVLTGSSDCTVRLWDAKSGQLLREPLRGHTGSVMAVAFSPDGLRTVSGAEDGTLRLWDMSTHRPIGESIAAHAQRVRCVAFSEDGECVLSGSEDNTVRVWDATTRRPIFRVLKGHDSEVQTVSMSPNRQHVLSASVDNTVRMWNLEGVGESDDSMRGHSVYVRHTAISTDGRLVASACGDGAVRFWDVARKEVTTMQVRVTDAALKRVCFAPDGRHVGFSGRNGTVGVVDIDGVPFTRTMEPGHRGVVHCLRFSDDGRLLGSGATDLRVWNAMNGVLTGQPMLGHGCETRCVVFLDGDDGGRGRVATGAIDGSLCLWGRNGECDRFTPFTGGQGGLYSMCLARGAGGAALLIGLQNGALCVWDVAEKKVRGDAVVAHDSCVRCVSESTGRMLVVSTAKDTRLMVWKWTPTEGLHAIGNRLIKVAQVTLPSFANSALLVGHGNTVETVDSDIQDHSIVVSLKNGVVCTSISAFREEHSSTCRTGNGSL